MADNLIEQQIKNLEHIIYHYDDMIFKNYENENIDDDEIENLQRKRDKAQEELNAFKKKQKFVMIEPQEEEKETKKEKEKEESKIYESFNDPNLNCNQWVVEIHKAGEWYYEKGEKKFKEDFSVYKDLKNALYRLGETKCCLFALMDYLNDNKHMFNFVLWRANFEKLTGFKEGTYRDTINAMFYYGILESTNRIKRNSKNVCCKVYIFHADLLYDKLPKERFEIRNKEHLRISKERKG